MKKLFIGNLPYQASEAELQDFFSQAAVHADSVQIIRDKLPVKRAALDSRSSPTTRQRSERCNRATAKNSWAGH